MNCEEKDTLIIVLSVLTGVLTAVLAAVFFPFCRRKVVSNMLSAQCIVDLILKLAVTSVLRWKSESNDQS